MKIIRIVRLDDQDRELAQRFVKAIEDVADSELPITLDLSDRVMMFLERTFIGLSYNVKLAGQMRFPGLTFESEDNMADYLLPDDQLDNAYVLPVVTLNDKEGNSITTDLEETFTSTDDTVIKINPGADFQHGTLTFGKPGVATVNHVLKHKGSPVFSESANFTLTTGTPGEAVKVGTMDFPGLTPIVPPTP
jgi:hypothetical protein